MLGDVQGQRRLSHGRPRSQDDQLAGVQTARHFIELGEPGADPLDPLAGIEERVQAALILIDNLCRAGQAGFHLRLAQLEQRLFGSRQNLRRLLFAGDAAVHQVLRREDDLPQNRLVLHDANVAFDIEGLRQPVIERDEVTQSVAGFELVTAHQLVGQGDAVDLFTAVMDFGHAGENAAMLLYAEVVGLQSAGRLDKVRIVQQNGSKDESFRIQIGWQPFFEYDSR